MRKHEIDVTNLIPVMPNESFIVTLEQKWTKKHGSRWYIKTVVGDLVELKKYEKKNRGVKA